MRLGSSLCAGLLVAGSCGGLRAADEPSGSVDKLPPQTIQGSAVCLRVDRSMDYKVIDSRTVIVWRSNRKDPHKVTLFQGCSRLRSGESIYFDTGGWGQLCGRGGEYLMVARPGIPRAPRPFADRRNMPIVDPELIEDRCAVASVEMINDDVVHELLVQGGHAQPRGPEQADQSDVLADDPASKIENNN